MALFFSLYCIKFEFHSYQIETAPTRRDGIFFTFFMLLVTAAGGGAVNEPQKRAVENVVFSHLWVAADVVLINFAFFCSDIHLLWRTCCSTAEGRRKKYSHEHLFVFLISSSQREFELCIGEKSTSFQCL